MKNIYSSIVGLFLCATATDLYASATISTLMTQTDTSSEKKLSIKKEKSAKGPENKSTTEKFDENNYAVSNNQSKNNSTASKVRIRDLPINLVYDTSYKEYVLEYQNVQEWWRDDNDTTIVDGSEV